MKSLGLEGISKSEVSRICEELNEALGQFRSRPLTSESPYVWLDAKVVKVRQDGRVVPVAIGGRVTGKREMRRWRDVAGFFPNSQAVLRLIGTVLAERHYFSSASMAALYGDEQGTPPETIKEVPTG